MRKVQTIKAKRFKTTGKLVILKKIRKKNSKASAHAGTLPFLFLYQNEILQLGNNRNRTACHAAYEQRIVHGLDHQWRHVKLPLVHGVQLQHKIHFAQ
jgi:hypothetical protein